MMTGKYRISAGGRPPEDVKLFPESGAQDFSGDSKVFNNPEKEKHVKQKLTRALRIVANDLENIPIGLIVMWGSLVCCYNVNAHIACSAGFALGRVGHTISYELELQPHRAWGWGLGIVSSSLLAANGVIGAFLL
ncbi:hypothetical protein TrLO_g8750 [Triparma laevis f. longispina]|uniref:Microsomal glutathione S-transferase 1 n=1 Tax=Triparma laevis f. longispina TaxID=1714387 RepID=A0A9W7CE17_9STRA|nr:hypothetical protein TrLO_g8750 [Triparma laevis f. longispina]